MDLDSLPVGQEDIILLIFVAGIILAAAVMQAGSPESGDTPTFCEKWAAETENNLSAQAESISCTCESGEKYRDRLDTPEEVREAANLYVINCEINGQEQLFPVWRINSTGNRTGNTTLGNGSASVIR